MIINITEPKYRTLVAALEEAERNALSDARDCIDPAARESAELSAEQYEEVRDWLTECAKGYGFTE